MRTTCDVSSGSLFCVGDLFPTLREQFPNRNVIFSFSTIKAPAVVVRQPERGGIQFKMLGLIEVGMSGINGDAPIGGMEIHIDASMRMKMTAKAVRGRVNLETIRLVTRSPKTLVQDELDDASFLSREILQRMVNDILKQGIPIPVHPLFKLQNPKLTLAERSMVLETNFRLNQNLIRQLVGEKLA
ncbi:LBP / BPI / CETP family protein [Trichostrongylus colubriformis]|uniref:LBP / BPI / CETP family protein n=1 Tax=Trichostrongylus colubriformis TaxID=6319 RepID=A0AAN8FY85_TRICO